MFGLMPNGELRQANLKMLFERARQFETASFKGLYNFIHFIDKLKLSSGDMGAAKIIGENDNVIRIMSIHKSKGLEFPIVFLASTGKQFNLMDLNQNILLHQELGIGVKYIDYEKQIQYDTLTKSAIKNKIFTETLSEEMRILYVAVTRAREKLIITGIKKDYKEEIEKLQIEVNKYKKIGSKINPILVKKYKKYLDWILLVYLYEKDNIKDIIDLNIISKKDVKTTSHEIEEKKVNIEEKLESHLKKLKENLGESDEISKIEKALNYEYTYNIDTKIPTKTSVTEIKRLSNAFIEENNINLLKIDKEIKEDINFETPKFMQTNEQEKLTGAQKGTLLHLCMQRLQPNREYNLEKIQKMIQDLVLKEVITAIEAENINVYAILKFTKSNIWKELQQAKEIHKEQPFYSNIYAKNIYHEETDEEILVQGIIDLYYINKNNELILVDYKTDYIEEGEEFKLISKYKKQLELYKQALENALNKRVNKIYIYSTYLSKEIEVIA